MIRLSLRASNHQDTSYMLVLASRLIILLLGTYHTIVGKKLVSVIVNFDI